MGSISEDMEFTGLVRLRNAQLTGTVTGDAAVKMILVNRRVTYAQANSTATNETRTIHVAGGSGTVLGVSAQSIGVCGSGSSVTVDVKKNGTTILSSAITLDNAATARTAVAGVLSGTPTCSTGDAFEVVITGSGGSLATGVSVTLTLNESYALA